MPQCYVIHIMSILSLLHSVVHATMISWIKWVFNVAAHFSVYAPVQGSTAGCFTARLLSHRKMLLLHFCLTYESALAKSGPITHYNFYFKYFCGMQNTQWIENKFLTPYSAPNNRTASESFLWLIKLFFKLTPFEHKNG